MRFAKTKSVLKANLEVQVFRRINSSKGAVIIDGNAILWCQDWPKECVLSHLAEQLCEYIEKKLMYNDVYLVFDRYKKFSIKGSTRSDRAKKIAYQLKFTPSTPLPCKEKIL